MKRNSFLAAIAVAVSATLSVGFVNVTPKVIYGEDNRADVYQIQRADVRELADSTVALIPNSSLKRDNQGLVHILAKNFGQELKLCPTEPFYDQPMAANCSGALVGEDLIATAGHCIRASDCDKYSFVFGFRMLDQKQAQQIISAEDVYACKEIVAREYTRAQDYALVRLDRVVRGRRILPLQQEPVQKGDDVFVIGHPAGLPTKIADGAKVRSQMGAYFQTNLDTYGGNSGSPVFNAKTNEIVGILVRGAQDFVADSENKCTVSNRCGDEGCRGEDVTSISYVSKVLTTIH